MTQISFKPAFVEHYSALTDFKIYKEAVSTFAPKSIRINTLKASEAMVKKSLLEQGWQLTPVPWCDEGFYIEHKNQRRDIGHTPEHEKGLIFSQRSVSMIPAIVLGPQDHDIVLDMCAAPGAKTTHIAAMMHNKGIIVANESDRLRIEALASNLQRCSVANTIVNHQSGEKIEGILFDKVLLDAPCSGTGLIKGKTKRTFDTIKTWNINMVRRLAKLQRKLILNAYNLLRDGGTLVYSTCSLEPYEDEEVVEYLLKETSAELDTINLPINAEKKKWIKIWPQDNNTEGFFVAKFTK